MGKRGRPPVRNLTPQNIKWAIESTQSMRQASDYLNVSYNSFRKYAELYDLWKPRTSSKGIRRSHSGRLTHDIGKILKGEHPSPYRESTLLMKGIREGYFKPCCSLIPIPRTPNKIILGYYVLIVCMNYIIHLKVGIDIVIIR